MTDSCQDYDEKEAKKSKMAKTAQFRYTDSDEYRSAGRTGKPRYLSGTSNHLYREQAGPSALHRRSGAENQERTGRAEALVLDAFSGSGIVSAIFKHASHIIANDLELYSKIINTCYLTNRRMRKNWGSRSSTGIDEKTSGKPFYSGIISELYAPGGETRFIGENVFLHKDALYLDTARTLIDEYRRKSPVFSLLLSEASVHANSAGVFKGFYKNRRTGIGQFREP